MDSYENGIGGYLLLTSKALHFELLTHFKGRVSNNVIEYLAELAAIWVGILD